MTATISGTNGLTVPQGAVYNGIASAIAQASTSGTSIDFTSIPSWVKRITVMFNGVSTSGTSTPQIQLGSGSVTTSGYVGAASGITTSSVNSTNYSTGALLGNAITAGMIFQGAVTITKISSNTWTFNGTLGRSDAAATFVTGGYIALSGVLDSVRITTVGGTDTFDAGSINILYE